MPFLTGITVLLAYQLAGEVTVRVLELPIPGPVMGMVFLFATLVVRRAVPESVDHAAVSLLSHLSLLFVPAGVGVMVHFSRIGDEWLPIVAALLVSTLATVAVTGLAMKGSLALLAEGSATDAE